jgi:beta-galactosidase/beta-glucuronidase
MSSSARPARCAIICAVRRCLPLLLPGALLLAALVLWHAAAARATGPTRPHRASAHAATASEELPPAPVALDGGWSYLPDPDNVGLSENWGQGGAPTSGWTPVSIPNDFNPTVTSTSDQGTAGWYQTTFLGPAISAGRSWRVSFEGVRRNATVWLNGYELGSNHNPYAPFSLAAPTLRPDQENTLIVRVDNYRGAGSFPEDWWNWGGIMGPVSLVPAGRLAIPDLGVVPELACHFRCGELHVLGTLQNRSTVGLAPNVLVRVTSPSGSSTSLTHALSRLGPGSSRTLSFTVPIRSPELWSPSHPALYEVEVEVRAGERVEEQDSLQVGMRSAQVSHGILYLNGRRLWLHGASIQEDTDGQGAALTDADIQQIVSELKALGANITRTHYELSPRLLDALDRAGIMVWAQPDVEHADARLQSAAGRAQALGQLRTTLLADRNHPSVIVDSVASELSSTPDSSRGDRIYLDDAIALARRLNPGVPVGLDIYCYTNYPAQAIYRRLDVLGIDDYFGWDTGSPAHSIAQFSRLEPYLQLQHRRYPNQALVISEYGAEAFYDGPASTKGTYAFQSDYIRRSYDVFERLPFLNGSIYWTLREFAVMPGWTGGATLPPGYVPDGIHHKGLIAYDGTPKPAFSVAQQLFAERPPFVPRADFATGSPAPGRDSSAPGGGSSAPGGGSSASTAARRGAAEPPFALRLAN